VARQDINVERRGATGYCETTGQFGRRNADIPNRLQLHQRAKRASGQVKISERICGGSIQSPGCPQQLHECAKPGGVISFLCVVVRLYRFFKQEPARVNNGFGNFGNHR
jgi:hypothetical protein